MLRFPLPLALAAAALVALVAPPPSVARADGEKAKEFTINVPATTAKAGTPATARVEVKPAAGWHINLEFPTTLTLKPVAGVELAKPKLGKKDAGVVVGEQEARFDVPFTPREAGKK